MERFQVILFRLHNLSKEEQKVIWATHRVASLWVVPRHLLIILEYGAGRRISRTRELI